MTMIRYFRTYALAWVLAAVLGGCIKNDIPYPVVECRIDSIAAEGLSGEPAIDYSARRVTLPLLETTDICNVRITGVSVTDGAEESVQITGVHDLRSPLYVTLSLYQDYPWEIVAEQNISRTFTVDGQVGATEWNLVERTARVYVGFEDMTSVNIRSLKLGPAGITLMSCTDEKDFNDSNLGILRDFTSPRRIDVTCHGRTEAWYLSVEYTDVKVALTQVDGWVRTAWLYAEGLSGSRFGFRYREYDAPGWTEVPEEDIKVDGGSFSARLRGLQPSSRYEVVATSGDDESAVTVFTTEAELPLPNGGFEDWSQPGSIVYPYLSEDSAFWDTGNKGAAMVKKTITEASTDTPPGSPGRYSAALTSTFASLAGVGKFAAGNIFVGTYAETVGTNGKVNFGRPFTSRPVALRGWVKFSRGLIDQIDRQPRGMNLTHKDYDQGSIYIALGTWTAAGYGGTAQSPVQIYTLEESTYFDKNSEDVVGYGEWMLTENIDDWKQFTIPIVYKATNIVPTHLIIVCSASRWGDYFTGSTHNRMWLDDFELVWE